MIRICRTAALIVLAVAIACAPAMAQTYAGGGAYASAGGQAGGGSVSTGTGGTQTFSLGSGYMYSMVSVDPGNVRSLQDQGIRTITVPAGSMVYITAQTGQPLTIDTGGAQKPNMIVFGPGGFAGLGVFGGQGAGAYAGAGSAGTGTITVPSGSMQMYSFTGSPGQAFLITQQTGGNIDRVLVVFQ